MAGTTYKDQRKQNREQRSEAGETSIMKITEEEVSKVGWEVASRVHER